MKDKEYEKYTYMKDLQKGELYCVQDLGYGEVPYGGRSVVATVVDSDRGVLYMFH